MNLDEGARSFEHEDARLAAFLDAEDSDLRRPHLAFVAARRPLSPEARESLARLAEARLGGVRAVRREVQA